MNGRIWFEGNPWPDGHELDEFTFAACLHEGGVGLLLHCRTREYADEYPEEDEAYDDFEILDDYGEGPETASGWLSKDGWGNFHSAILSNLFWGIDYKTVPSFRLAADGRGGALAPQRIYEIAR